jgi:hypothetical protein
MRLLIALVPFILTAQQPPDAFQIGTASNLYTTDAIVNLTNASTSNICANTYLFNQDRFIACCSSLIKPQQQYVISAQNLLPVSLSLDGSPNSLTIKLLASTTITGAQSCNPAWPDTVDKLATGLRASIQGVPFQQAQLSSCVATSPGHPCMTELQQLSLFCGFILANGSGFGICRQATAVATTQQDDLSNWLYFFI